MSLNFSDLIREAFVPNEKLLADTETATQNLPEYEALEGEFRYWEKILNDDDSANDTEAREEITALRKNLRERGYNLSLSSVQLDMEDVRNDDAIALGYRRLVICITKKAIYAISGDENHVDTGIELDRILQEKGISDNKEFHYLWYLKEKDVFHLAAAATELPEDYKKFKTQAEENPLRFISAVNRLP